jgi:hypothetical protein
MELWIGVWSHGEREIEGLFMHAFRGVAFLLWFIMLVWRTIDSAAGKARPGVEAARAIARQKYYNRNSQQNSSRNVKTAVTSDD